jgi:hypothetical protein
VRDALERRCRTRRLALSGNHHVSSVLAPQRPKVLPMGHSLLQAGNYDPDRLKQLCDAFDGAWEDIAPTFSRMSIEERRTRLAVVILALAEYGEWDAKDMKESAIRVMRRRGRPPKKLDGRYL